MKKRMGWGHFGVVLGSLLALPLIYVIVTFISPKNPDAEQYIDRYIDDGRLIAIPAVGEYKEKSKTYLDKMHFKKNRGNVSADQFIFYSSSFDKYFAIYTFEGAGLDIKTQKTKKMYFYSHSVYKAFLYQSTIVAMVNKRQWDDPDYGTKKKPLPLFGVNVFENTNDVDDYGSYVMQEVVNHKYVEQYLKHYMPTDEFKQMFKDK